MAYDINSLLRRTLQSGEKYNVYFKDSSCTPSYLGTNDTAFTVAKMKEWATKNVSQTKKLALAEFTGRPLKETVDMVYSFLYNHIQYKLDGNRQNLKSPACAWATRSEGSDCKSYSIAASTILSNLGIVHFFRRVKQPGENQDKWTHVYVVVPENQKNPKKSATGAYYVLDATVHDNKEVRFTEKSDTLMGNVSLVHYGLQAPAVHLRGLAGCSCTPKPITTNPTPIYVNPLPQPQPLINGGIVIPRTTTQEVRSNTVVSATPRGTVSATPRENTTTTVRSSTTTATAPRSGGSSVLRMAPTEALKSPNLWGMGYVATPTLEGAPVHGNNLSKGSNIANVAGQTLGMLQQGGGAGSIIKGAAGILPLAIGTGPAAPFVLAGAAILALIPNRFYDKVIGQFFSNGLRADCIGSSRSPSTSKKDLQKDIPLVQAEAQKMIQSFQSGNIAQIEGAINLFMEFFYSVEAKGRWWLANGARDCTRDGIMIHIKGLDEAKKEILKITDNTLKQYGASLVQNGTRKIIYPANPAIDKPENTFDIEQYKVVVDQSIGAQQTQNNTNSSLTNFLPKISTAGFTGNAFMILAAIAAGTYIISKQ